MSEALLGAVGVYTTEHRGFTPEEIANMTIDKIISVGDKSHPLLVAQARAYRDQIYRVLIDSLTEAQKSERDTICARLNGINQNEIANVIRSF